VFSDSNNKKKKKKKKIIIRRNNTSNTSIDYINYGKPITRLKVSLPAPYHAPSTGTFSHKK